MQIINKVQPDEIYNLAAQSHVAVSFEETSLDLFQTQLEAEWAQGCHNGAELWRRLRAAGYTGAPRVVSEWATRKRANEAAAVPRRPPAARVIARMLTVGRDQLSKMEEITAAMIERASPALMIARDLMDRFHSLIRTRNGDGLNSWIHDAKTSLLGSFCSGIIRDRNVVHAAITEPWSNGQTEGQINKLKLIKRQMYGRAKLDLLRARMIGAS